MDLAAMLKHVLGFYYYQLNDTPFNMSILTCPIDRPPEVEVDAGTAPPLNQCFHWYLALYPRSVHPHTSGFENGTGIKISSHVPEEDATVIRNWLSQQLQPGCMKVPRHPEVQPQPQPQLQAQVAGDTNGANELSRDSAIAPFAGALKPVFSFGVIADVQYADADDGSDFHQTVVRRYRNSLHIVNKAVDDWLEQEQRLGYPIQLLAQLGDLLDGRCQEKEDNRDACLQNVPLLATLVCRRCGSADCTLRLCELFC